MKIAVFEGCWGHPALESTEYFLVHVCVFHCHQKDGIAKAAQSAGANHIAKQMSEQGIASSVVVNLSFPSGNDGWGTIKLSPNTGLQAGNLNGLLNRLIDHPVEQVCTETSGDPWCRTALG